MKEYDELLKGNKEACVEFLKTRHALLGEAAVSMEKDGMFHLDLNNGTSINFRLCLPTNASRCLGNIHWEVLDDTAPPNLLDFGNMAERDSEERSAVSVSSFYAGFFCFVSKAYNPWYLGD
jgi:hypothetical protein